jgi:hypothetical protein
MSSQDAAPDAIPKVDGDGVNGVINPDFDKEAGPEDVGPAGDDANWDGGPRLDQGAADHDTNDPREPTVLAHGDGVRGLPGLAAVEDHVE